MKPSRQILLLVAAFLAGAAGVWALSGDDDDQPSDPPPTVEAPAEPVLPKPPPNSKPPAEEKPTPAEEEARRVEAAVRSYVEAISDHDGVWLCGRVEGIADLDLPVRRGSCAESVSESIGYRDPRGYPVFEKSAVAGTPQVELDGARARVTVTVVTEFADRDEPSVEDDVVYLVRRGGMWVVAKPSSTLYRAIGTPDVPPEVIQPPG